MLKLKAQRKIAQRETNNSEEDSLVGDVHIAQRMKLVALRNIAHRGKGQRMKLIAKSKIA
jgi:hypothetical protein